MSNIIKCDKCKKIIKDRNDSINLHISDTNKLIFDKMFLSLDLCSGCVKKLKPLLNKLLANF